MEIEELGETFPVIGSGLPRAPGLHVSTVIKYIMDTIAPYKGDGFDDMALTMEIGFIWEDLLSYVLGNRLGHRLQDIKCDGLYGNPDGIGKDPLGLVPVVVDEYKCTWRSMKRSPTEDMRWMMQLKSYCHMIGLTVAVMHICYLMGDYKGSGPMAKSFRIEFTPEEIKENWDVIMDHKAQLEAEVKNDQ